MNYKIEFIPDEPIDEWEFACRKVANLLDNPEWKWLGKQINDQRLSWPSIMELVAKYIN